MNSSEQQPTRGRSLARRFVRQESLEEEETM